MTEKPTSSTSSSYQREPSRLFKIMNPELYLKRTPGTLLVGIMGTAAFVCIISVWSIQYYKTGKIGTIVVDNTQQNQNNNQTTNGDDIVYQQPKKEWKRVHRD
eukprot:TRINITY_DN7275_c0_g1_i1.p1 TRINITY_DN7275_c0_g1~~TRINITY_DN7275_c0_g1_i1.p1  ORF type:complete len:113 (+),score=33.30 TRINITY_DN7275_c0_g1_i1:33-341(+)